MYSSTKATKKKSVILAAVLEKKGAFNTDKIIIIRTIIKNEHKLSKLFLSFFWILKWKKRGLFVLLMRIMNGSIVISVNKILYIIFKESILSVFVT